jgi:ribonucleoside-diphosphate reductase alpha chain
VGSRLLPFDTLALLDAGARHAGRREPDADGSTGRRSTPASPRTACATRTRWPIAPTATIANIAGCYPCIEPIYRNIYVKANISGEFTIVNAHLVRDLKALGLWSADMLDHLKYFDGNLRMIAGVPDRLKEKYRETFEIDPIAALQATAVRGKWIDQSQAHTCS